jgi:hypothetical protein
METIQRFVQLDYFDRKEKNVFSDIFFLIDQFVQLFLILIYNKKNIKQRDLNHYQIQVVYLF